MYVTGLLEKTKLMSSQVALQQVSESLSSVKAALCHKPYQTMTAQICQSGHIVSKSISDHLALRTVTSYAQYRVCGVFLSCQSVVDFLPVTVCAGAVAAAVFGR